MKQLFFIAMLSCGFGLSTKAQYAPQATINSTTAISAGSPQLVGWANACVVKRGYLDIAQPALGVVSSGDSSMAVGSVDNFVVSLGDSGVATLTFANPIFNGAGFDFAVFENGFLNPADNEEAFLELAFVEVSSDGVNFHRFPASSLTQTTSQISSVAGQDYMNARLLNNLAGKYISNYGTPFDLQDLAGINTLDINHITHVRIVDVVGSIGEHSSYDTAGNKINDPYPTNFPIGGFDLDAVGVIHQTATSVGNNPTHQAVTVYPNPASDYIVVKSEEPVTVVLCDVTGKALMQFSVVGKETIFLDGLPGGFYLLQFKNDKGVRWAERISKL